jgi:hypothetical protein
MRIYVDTLSVVMFIIDAWIRKSFFCKIKNIILIWFESIRIKTKTQFESIQIQLELYFEKKNIQLRLREIPRIDSSGIATNNKW